LGARCERALAAAVFDFLPVLLLRSTAAAAFAALAEVLRLLGIGASSLPVRVVVC
jgi:hypothetical protein